jgi:hypothetical protein
MGEDEFRLHPGICIGKPGDVRRGGAALRDPPCPFYLAAGLKNFPEDIKRRYARSVFQHRPHFGVGVQIE